MDRATVGALTAVAAGACYLCHASPQESSQKQRPLKVIIAGGGIGGLCTALKLHQVPPPLTVCSLLPTFPRVYLSLP